MIQSRPEPTVNPYQPQLLQQPPPQPLQQQPQQPQQPNPYAPNPYAANPFAQQPQNTYPHDPQNPYGNPYPQNTYPYNNPYMSQQSIPAKLPGSTMVRVCGILLTIIGVLSFLGSFNRYTTMMVGGEEIIIETGGPFAAITGLVFLVSGILGIALCKRKEMSTVFTACGAAMIVMTIIDVLIQAPALFVLFNDQPEFLIGYFVGLGVGIALSSILPILYIAGGIKMKRSNY